MAQNKQASLSYHQTIREAIQKIALRGLVNQDTGAIRDTGKITGYVAKIHTEGDLAGTVDVQEYLSMTVREDSGLKLGYHEGVFLSALQDNSKGFVIVPKMYSEVVITTDPETKTEYVTMFSHVDIIQLDSHEKITVGVTEREDFDEEDEDSPDIQDLEETGVFTKTTYIKDSVVTEVQGKEKSSHVKQTIDSSQVNTVVGDDKSSTVINQKQIQLKHGKAEEILGDNSLLSKFGSSMVKIEDGVVYVGSESGTDDAVLGVELATILSEMLGCIGQIMTTTMMGPQPPLNAASFIALKARIESFKSSHSGFLTKKVQIQK